MPTRNPPTHWALLVVIVCSLIIPSWGATPTEGELECPGSVVLDPLPSQGEALIARLDAYEEQMSSLFAQSFLDEMDELLLDETEPDWTVDIDSDDLPLHIVQEIESKPLSDVVQDVVDLTDLETPALWAKMMIIEDSHHKEFWSFDIRVTALCGGKAVGHGQGVFEHQDTRARHDLLTHRTEITIKNLEIDINDVEVLAVGIQTTYCAVGWFSGGGKLPPESRGEPKRKCIFEEGADALGFVHETLYLHLSR